MQHDFLRYSSSSKKIESQSKITEISTNDPYIDGFEVIGDLSRQRNKSKEIRNDFCSTSTKDPWSTIFPKPVSNSNYYSMLRSDPLIKSSKIYPNSFESFKLDLMLK
jgi:hypothetical protein